MRVLLSAAFILAIPAPALADVTLFKTPSGNIECTVGTGEGPSDIECRIFKRSAPPPSSRPTGCKEAWGHRFSMRARGVVTIGCGGPGLRIMAASGNVARYGDTGKFDGIVCHSSKKGLECRNADGHGFFLSRRRQSVF